MTKEKLIQNLIEEGYLKTPEIIDAFKSIDRADFVLPEYRNRAYADTALPLVQGQTISQPLTVALLFELLQPRPGEKVLDVGSGSGWTTALLAHIVSSGGKEGRVYAMELVLQLCELGKKHLGKYGFIQKGIVVHVCRDATNGLPEYAPFDKILAGAAASREIPSAWQEQLKTGGNIVAPVGGSIRVFTKISETDWEQEEYPGFAFVPLVSHKLSHGINTMENNKLKIRKNFFRSFLVACLLSLVGLGTLAYEIYLPHASYAGNKIVEITPGMGSRKIGEKLKQERFIQSKWAFVFYVTLKNTASLLKPGTYTFAPSSIPTIARDLESGANRENVITIPEGWTVRDISDLLAARGIPVADAFETNISGPDHTALRERFSFIRALPPRSGIEGYLFPDTYKIFQDSSGQDIAAIMVGNFDRKITPELRAEIEAQKKRLHDVIIMASMIEKEVPADSDRKLISGILWKRLALDIPLQVDATLTYIKKQQGAQTDADGKVYIIDTKIDSPYNTYRYHGLPIGPIANPGMSAILAAIHPTKSPYLYYLSTPDGHTVYSKTLEEHNIAKAKYLTK